MNVNMWRHPATLENVERLRARGVHFVGPDAGALACGWEGEGRMSEPAVIASEADRWLAEPTLAGERVLVTAGGTREPIDPVRAITNRSSGKMGFAIAAEAARRGADVVLVAGPVSLATPPGVRRIDVETALEMHEVVVREAERAGVTVMAAAVADFRPAALAAHKIKKEDLAENEAPSIALVRNPDILAEISARAARGIVVGFAAESRDLLAAARRKLARKRCDLIVANDVSREGAGFDGDTNAVVLVWPGGDSEELPLSSKSEVAAMLWDRIESLRKPNA
jgi:phosphopantothenoylcysteine decarboxylase/phosphopantothenate--cysteine ligase